MSVWGAGLLLLAAITVTYLFCIRPHLRGSSSCGMAGASKSDAEMDRQVGELREELRVLRAQDALDSGRVSSRTTPPPPKA
jgi:hypothetical protein